MNDAKIKTFSIIQNLFKKSSTILHLFKKVYYICINGKRAVLFILNILKITIMNKVQYLTKALKTWNSKHFNAVCNRDTENIKECVEAINRLESELRKELQNAAEKESRIEKIRMKNNQDWMKILND